MSRMSNNEGEWAVDAEIHMSEAGGAVYCYVQCTDPDGNPATHRVSFKHGENGKLEQVIGHDHAEAELTASVTLAHLGGTISACARLVLWLNDTQVLNARKTQR